MFWVILVIKSDPFINVVSFKLILMCDVLGKSGLESRELLVGLRDHCHRNTSGHLLEHTFIVTNVVTDLVAVVCLERSTLVVS